MNAEPMSDHHKRLIFRGDELPPELLNPVSAEEPSIAITKRSAKRVAEELTKRLVRVRDSRGCEIIVSFPRGGRSFIGSSWWLALRKLNAHLLRQALPKSEP